jgi:hypothetical protein
VRGRVGACVAVEGELVGHRVVADNVEVMEVEDVQRGRAGGSYLGVEGQEGW